MDSRRAEGMVMRMNVSAEAYSARSWKHVVLEPCMGEFFKVVKVVQFLQSLCHCQGEGSIPTDGHM